MENPCFLGTLEWFFMIYAGTKIPPVFQTPICETFHTQTHTHISHIDRNFQIPVAGIWSQGAALSVNGDLVIQFISFQSLSEVSRRWCPKTDECFVPPQWWMVKNVSIFLVPWTHPERFYHRYPQSGPRILRRNGHPLDRPGCYRWQILLQAQCYSS